MPDKPFFMYFAPGATYAHVPKEWIEKYKGHFVHGWDEQRERTFAKQKELGVIRPTPTSRCGMRRSRPGTTCQTSSSPS